jgi:hypothetical protein
MELMVEEEEEEEKRRTRSKRIGVHFWMQIQLQL